MKLQGAGRRTVAGITLGGLALAAVPATGAPSADAVPAPVIQPLPLTPEAPANEPAPPVPLAEVQMAWSLADARALLAVIETIEAEGLIPADYAPEALRAAIAGGEGDALNRAASHSFTWLAEDLRDGRTPMTARVQWFALDPDQDENPTPALMARALETSDVAGVLASLAPVYPDYAALKDELARTPKSNVARRNLIRANMDRWRWLKRDLGTIYLITNVPEFQLRLTVNSRIIRTYRTVVGKPGRTATPQLAETVTAVVFNPTWTVPQSIVVGEGLGQRLLANPASAARQGYRVSKAANGMITVVQQPGDNNALGRMKIDMPNPHAIYLHDTPAKALFNTPVRAYSHGCIRTERAVELGMTMAILGADLTPEQAVEHNLSGKYTKVDMKRTFPVYITYKTMGLNIDGQLATFADIYGRDAPVLASFNAPRVAKTTQRTSTEEVIQLDNPL
ncbi:MAG TPA: L,D-transpeptidase family protein [Novosphingobium sp.]|nr:L,D-transpeptidase family protein [Novosphingobium sp.]